VKLVTWNVQLAEVRLPQVVDWLDAAPTGRDLPAETKLEDGKFPAVEIETAGYHAVYSGQKDYNGVAILARARPRGPSWAIPGFADEQKPRARLRRSAACAIVCLYVPNGQSVGSASTSTS